MGCLYVFAQNSVARREIEVSEGQSLERWREHVSTFAKNGPRGVIVPLTA